MSKEGFPIDSDSTYIIAEGEINHNGSVEIALDMVSAAKDAGADAIKFQYIVADEIAAKGTDFHKLFSKVELSFEELSVIRDKASGLGVDFFITAPSLGTLPQVNQLEPCFIKIGSTNITNIPLLEGIAALGRPVILSTGASRLGEIENALIALTGVSVALLHCTVNYPAKTEDLNLKAITTMRSAFPDRVVGYSDHSIGDTAAVAAAALGARIIEKHFTLDKSMEGPDHSFSTDPIEFARLVAAVRACEEALGTGKKEPSASEANIPMVARRFVVAARNIPAGSPILALDLNYRRVDYVKGLVRVEEHGMIIDMISPRNYIAGEALNWDHFKAGGVV